MKTSAWIKLIGIICIVFGSFGVMEQLLGILMPVRLAGELPESPFLEWEGVLVKMIYLFAGIFFLMKRRFSINLMYFALIINILFGIVPLTFLYNGNPPDNNPDAVSVITGLIGPSFNLLLLFFVFRIRKNYLRSDAEVNSLGEASLKPVLKVSRLRAFTVAGFFCMALPLSIMGLWFYSSASTSSQGDAFNHFKSYFPLFLQGRFSTSYLSLILCVVAFIFSITALKLTGRLPKTLNIIVLVLSSILFLMNTWSLL